MEINYLSDNELTLADKGMAALLLAMNESGISPSVEKIREYAANGKTAISSIMKNLEACGYLQRIKAKEQGRWKIIYDIRRTPDFISR